MYLHPLKDKENIDSPPPSYRQLTMENRQWTMENRQWTMENRQWKTDNRQEQ